MTRKRVFLVAAMAVASLAAMAQNNSAGAPASAQQHQVLVQQQQDNNVLAQNHGGNDATLGARDSAQTTPPAPASKSNERGPEGKAVGDQTPAASEGQLPQTSTILPLLGLIGLGSLVAGFFARR